MQVKLLACYFSLANVMTINKPEIMSMLHGPERKSIRLFDRVCLNCVLLVLSKTSDAAFFEFFLFVQPLTHARSMLCVCHAFLHFVFLPLIHAKPQPYVVRLPMFGFLHQVRQLEVSPPCVQLRRDSSRCVLCHVLV